ncbi:MAG TPA: hypothetical protein VET89_12305 [Stellaceae bacterium]|nr:hypothetical protein [Stellaceae bacterium]
MTAIAILALTLTPAAQAQVTRSGGDTPKGTGSGSPAGGATPKGIGGGSAGGGPVAGARGSGVRGSGNHRGGSRGDFAGRHNRWRGGGGVVGPGVWGVPGYDAWFDEPAYSYYDWPYGTAPGYYAAPAYPNVGSYWYYCASPAGYYPYVQQCQTPWQPVVPRG